MPKNYYKTSDGLLFILYNTQSERKIISEFHDVEVIEFNRKNNTGKSVSIAAIEQHKNMVFEYLVSQGIDLTLINSAGYDLLFICTMRGNYAAAKLLLDRHDFKDTISPTLDYSILTISAQNLDIIKLLIEKGGTLSEYHLNYLSDITQDGEFKYNRQELREFYERHHHIHDSPQDSGIDNTEPERLDYTEILELTGDIINDDNNT